MRAEHMERASYGHRLTVVTTPGYSYYMSNHGTLWTDMAPRAFDTAAPDVQLGLFAADSQGYTGADLFTEREEEAAAADEIKTGDYVVRGLEAPARVTEVGAGWVELRREAGASYRIETMHVRKVGNAR